MRHLLMMALAAVLLPAMGCSLDLGRQPAAPARPAAPAAPQATQPTTKTAGRFHVAAAKAHFAWKNQPEHAHILDVRTPGEYIFVGHPPMARNIPYMLLGRGYDARKKGPTWRANPEFVAEVAERYGKGDTLFVLCKSGERSGQAVADLRAAGYAKAYNIQGGFEGGTLVPCNCPGGGMTALDGWKAEGLVWTYDLDPELMYLAE